MISVKMTCCWCLENVSCLWWVFFVRMKQKNLYIFCEMELLKCLLPVWKVRVSIWVSQWGVTRGCSPWTASRSRLCQNWCISEVLCFWNKTFQQRWILLGDVFCWVCLSIMYAMWNYLWYINCFSTGGADYISHTQYRLCAYLQLSKKKWSHKFPLCVKLF